MKKLNLASVLLSALLLSACGSSSGNSNSALSSKRGILIYTNSSPGACEKEDTRQLFYNQGYRGLLLKEISNNSRCETFGRTSGNTCAVYPVPDNPNGSVACAVGFDSYVGTKSTEDIAIYETFEILESELQ
jgi:hypothetical protein